MDINKLKIAVASITCEYLDEFDANIALWETKRTMIDAIGGDLEMMQARVLCDAGDSFQYLELDLPNGTSPDDAHRVLLKQYYDSGEYGPDSYILSVIGITKDGEFWEIPFSGDTPLKKLEHWLSVRVQSGTSVYSPNDVWTKKSIHLINQTENVPSPGR